MLARILTSHRLHRLVIGAAVAVGIILVIAIDNERAGIITFLSITVAESLTFVLIYGLRSDWRRVPAARAVFWAVLGYFCVAASELQRVVHPFHGWVPDNIRESSYLVLSVAGLNLVLVLTRVLGPRVWRGDVQPHGAAQRWPIVGSDAES